jgi:hypothetical protein
VHSVAWFEVEFNDNPGRALRSCTKHGAFFVVAGLGQHRDSGGGHLLKAGNGLLGRESWNRVGQHRPRPQDTFPYLASAPPCAGAFSCG